MNTARVVLEANSVSNLFMGIQHISYWCTRSLVFLLASLPLKAHSYFLMILTETDCSGNTYCLGLSLSKHTLFCAIHNLNEIGAYSPKIQDSFQSSWGRWSKKNPFLCVFSCYSKKASVLFQVLAFMAKVVPKIQYTFKWLWDWASHSSDAFFFPPVMMWIQFCPTSATEQIILC